MRWVIEQIELSQGVAQVRMFLRSWRRTAGDIQQLLIFLKRVGPRNLAAVGLYNPAYISELICEAVWRTLLILEILGWAPTICSWSESHILPWKLVTTVPHILFPPPVCVCDSSTSSSENEERLGAGSVDAALPNDSIYFTYRSVYLGRWPDLVGLCSVWSKKIRTPILFWKPPTHIVGNYVSLLVLILGG